MKHIYIYILLIGSIISGWSPNNTKKGDALKIQGILETTQRVDFQNITVHTGGNDQTLYTYPFPNNMIDDIDKKKSTSCLHESNTTNNNDTVYTLKQDPLKIKYELPLSIVREIVVELDENKQPIVYQYGRKKFYHISISIANNVKVEERLIVGDTTLKLQRNNNNNTQIETINVNIGGVRNIHITGFSSVGMVNESLHSDMTCECKIPTKKSLNELNEKKSTQK